MNNITSLTYPERLQTFEDYWNDNLATARQLAAIGHVSDRPPLETLEGEDGSRCISCSAFVRKDVSIKALEGTNISSKGYEDCFSGFSFHHPSCIRLQVRIPLDPQAILPGLHGNRIAELKRRFERKRFPMEVRTNAERASQISSLFTLPTEIRLEIYAMILPSFEEVTEILPLNRDSPRVVTSMGYEKTGPRDTTKPNILRTCRTVHEEAADLLYSTTTFKFGSTKNMYLFLHSVGHRGRQLIKAVDVHCGGREDAITFALLGSCGKLRKICIRLPRPMILFSRAPIWIVDGVSCLLALSGLEKVAFGGCKPSLTYMSDEKPDAAIIRTELTRSKDSPADVQYVKNYLDT